MCSPTPAGTSQRRSVIAPPRSWCGDPTRCASRAGGEREPGTEQPEVLREPEPLRGRLPPASLLEVAGHGVEERERPEREGGERRSRGAGTDAGHEPRAEHDLARAEGEREPARLLAEPRA